MRKHCSICLETFFDHKTMQHATRQHLYNYDLLRGIAILLVAVQHAWSMSEMDTDEWGLLCFGYRTVVNCGVPLFVIMSGALLLDAPIRPMKEFFKRRFARVLYPFLLWATAVYLLSFVTHKYDEVITWKDFFIKYIPYLLSNQINDFHWYVHMILALYLIAPFLQRALSLCSRKTLDCLMLGWLAGMLARAFCPNIYLLHYTTSLYPYLGCFIAGYYLRHYCYSKSLRWWSLSAFVAFAVVDVITETRLSYIEPLMAISLFAFFSVRPMNKKPNGSDIMVMLSRYSYIIYLIHIPVIRFILNLTGARALLGDIWMPMLQPLWIAAIAVAICVMFCHALELIHLPASVLYFVGITPRCSNKEKKQ